jgi:hypothetical protein
VAAGEGAGAAPDRVLPVSKGCQRQGQLPVSQRGNAAGAQQGEQVRYPDVCGSTECLDRQSSLCFNIDGKDDICRPGWKGRLRDILGLLDGSGCHLALPKYPHNQSAKIVEI